jgi:catechol 2,3-dioxygenase-like lactoylglutathione lyase family enzyme
MAASEGPTDGATRGVSRRLFSHVDLRVRDRKRAKAFYDSLFGPLGMTAEVGKAFTSYAVDPEAPDPESEWLGFTEDPAMHASPARIAFYAASHDLVDRIAAAALAAGATNMEGPAVCAEYGPNYYAAFFDDPDGNRLEVCCFA